MGKSRSATVLLAYLLWSTRQSTTTSTSDPNMVSLPPKPLSVIEALTLLRQGRAIAEPNEGFMDQLYLFVDMGCPSTQSELESHKLYRRWMNKRNVAESLRINRAPDIIDIKFEDDDIDSEPTSKLHDLSLNYSEKSQQHQPIDATSGISAPRGTNSPSTTLPVGPTIRCRKCRTLLSTPSHLSPHTPSQSDPSTRNQPCTHIFLHPLSWMKEVLSEGKLEGRLSCPNKKCEVNVGKFAWQGLRCSCGGWVTPGFGVDRKRVDEVRSAGGKVEGSGGDVGGMGPVGGPVRLPPGMRGKGNL